MKTFLSHWTALRYWRYCWPLSSPVYRALRFRVPQNYAHAWAEVEPVVPWDAFEDGKPIDILVFSDAGRERNQHSITHKWSTHVPSSAFCDCGGDLYVSSPEFVFLQLAPELELAELIALGMELCGTYSLRTAASGEYCRRSEPLTNVKNLSAFVASSRGALGCPKANRAIKYIADKSASVGETETTMFLHLPALLGGYGIKKPLLNHRIDYSAEIALVAGRSYCVGDICWPKEHLDLEYFGKVHATPDSMESDAGRATALTIAGYKVLTLTHRQLYDLGQFEEVARNIARETGKRLYAKDMGPTLARTDLRSVVTAWHDRGGVPRGEEAVAPVVHRAVSWADDV